MDENLETPQRAPRHRRWHRWAPRAAFESLLIVFSVVLAMMVTDWADRRRTAAEVAEVRQFFVAEIRANRAILQSEAILPHHHRLLSAFGAVNDASATRAQAIGAYDQIFQTGIHVAPLRDAVWRSAETGELLGEMPIEELFLLADIYKAQTALETLSDGFISGMPAVLAGLETGEGVRAAIVAGQLHLGDVVSSEEALIALYDRALAALGAEGADPAATQADDAGPTKG